MKPFLIQNFVDRQNANISVNTRNPFIKKDTIHASDVAVDTVEKTESIFSQVDKNSKPIKIDTKPSPKEQQILPKTDESILDDVQILDRDWARQAFLISDDQMETALNGFDQKNRYYSTATAKFTDTRMGGNIGVNARPQFTHYSDICLPGRIKGRDPNPSVKMTSTPLGMGRYYSEAIDDNAQTVYLRFGVPQFNSLLSFFSKAFDPHMTTLARTGRTTSTWYMLGKVAGSLMLVSAAPALATAIIGGRVLSLFFSRQTSKYYTMKPTMHTYWSAVQVLVNMIAINKGLLPRFYEEMGLSPSSKGQEIGTQYKFDNVMMEYLHNAMPDIFTDSNGIDVFGLATRAQRIANQQYRNDYERLNKATATDFQGYVQKDYQDKIIMPEAHTFSKFLDELVKFGDYYKSDDRDTRLELTPKVDPVTGEPVQDAAKDKFLNYFDAEFRGGAEFAIFKVDHTGAVSESFSNSVVESDISQKFNSTSSTARSARFTFAEGNVAGETLQGIMGAVGEVISGTLSGVTGGLFDGIAGLAGSGYIDIPKHWQSSTAQLPHSSYTIQLIAPYGNVISQLQNIYIPLCMLLAGSLPLSTGSQSYTSPFLCQIYDRGRCQIQLGMIDQISIQRGTCNLPFNNRGNVMAIDVTFSVADLSSIMHMPISTGALFGGMNAIDEDNILMDYLAVLSGQDMYSQLYAIPKAKLNFAKTLRGLQNFTSPAYWASTIHDTMTTGMLRYAMVGPIIEGLADAPASITR